MYEGRRCSHVPYSAVCTALYQYVTVRNPRQHTGQTGCTQLTLAALSCPGKRCRAPSSPPRPTTQPARYNSVHGMYCLPRHHRDPRPHVPASRLQAPIPLEYSSRFRAVSIGECRRAAQQARTHEVCALRRTGYCHCRPQIGTISCRPTQTAVTWLVCPR